MKESQPDTGPVPDDFFQPLPDGKKWDQHEYVSPHSGQTLVCSKYSWSIIVQDLHDSGFAISLDKAGNTFQACVRTRGWHGSPNLPHPDLHASDILRKEFRYFAESGRYLIWFMATWNSDGPMNTNFKMFKEYMDRKKVRLQFRTTITRIDAAHPAFGEMSEAAECTWTGKLLKTVVREPRVVLVDTFRQFRGNKMVHVLFSLAPGAKPPSDLVSSMDINVIAQKPVMTYAK